jgi:hypothetical protein
MSCTPRHYAAHSRIYCRIHVVRYYRRLSIMDIVSWRAIHGSIFAHAWSELTLRADQAVFRHLEAAHKPTVHAALWLETLASSDSDVFHRLVHSIPTPMHYRAIRPEHHNLLATQRNSQYTMLQQFRSTITAYRWHVGGSLTRNVHQTMR